MKTCKYCGEENFEEDAKFCASCGKSFQEEAKDEATKVTSEEIKEENKTLKAQKKEKESLKASKTVKEDKQKKVEETKEHNTEEIKSQEPESHDDAQNCLKCGAPLEEGASFCAVCGTSVKLAKLSGNNHYYEEPKKTCIQKI